MEHSDTILQIRLTPGAKKTGVDGLWNGTHWKVSVHARATDGQANEALIDFLSDEFDVPKSHIQIISGQTNRLKTVRIMGVHPVLWKAK